MKIRPAKKGDIPEVSKLYFNTVHKVNAKDYTPEQIMAWAPQIKGNEFWLKRWEDCWVLVAVEKGEVLGFVELRSDGMIDCFYVHHEAVGRGVGKALMEEVIRLAKEKDVTEIFADVSITAKSFFLRMGFTVEKKKYRDLRGQRFKQFFMKLPLR